ncbi:FAD-binding oxidoreductase [Saccharicrinis sp. FJH2]|uniref:FAD-binding oxidoreductase n=1 Tax=unclassified Saccharicrinis TaxID=2646859 RepID=UPI0035D45630
MNKGSLHKVIEVRELTDTVYVLRVERNGFEFQSGQYLALGKKGDIQKREYSIYSGEKDEYLEVLIKEVLEGDVSKKLHKLKVGDDVEIEGPYGHFILNGTPRDKKIIFIASGTGISPCHSLIRSNPKLDYMVLHGVKYSFESYDRHAYHPYRYIQCTSRETEGDFYGRVTDYLSRHGADAKSEYFLCGNSNMIYDVFDILKDKGVKQDQIHTEVYF